MPQWSLFRSIVIGHNFDDAPIASMSPPIVAVSVSFAEPPLRLQFVRPLERFLRCHPHADWRYP
jgi:hypothetical protein